MSVQIYGTVSGVNGKRKIYHLKQGETIKRRFGVWLAKDFIPFAKAPNLLNDAFYHHYHI